MKSTLLAFALALPTLACDAQVGPDHQGELLLTVHGKVVPQGQEAPPAAAEAALLWGGGGFGALLTTTGFVGVTASVTGQFPIGFELNAFTPPPDSAYLPGTDMAFGYIVALAPNADHSSVGPDDVLGASVDTLVAYFRHDQASSPVGPLSAGYHLLALKLPSKAEHATYAACVLGGVCGIVHPDPAASHAVKSLYEAENADCLEAIPNATRCDIWLVTNPTADEVAQTDRCVQLLQTRERKDCGPNGTTFTLAPADATTTVTMGLSPWHVWP